MRLTALVLMILSIFFFYCANASTFDTGEQWFALIIGTITFFGGAKLYHRSRKIEIYPQLSRVELANIATENQKRLAKYNTGQLGTSYPTQAKQLSAYYNGKN